MPVPIVREEYCRKLLGNSGRHCLLIKPRIGQCARSPSNDQLEIAAPGLPHVLIPGTPQARDR